MKLRYISHLVICITFNVCLAKILPANAQIKIEPSGIQSPSQVTSTDQQTFRIQGGTQRGQNLIHRFQEFNLLENQSAILNPSSKIEKVILSVTGDNRSILDGFIDLGDVKKFLFVNKNGISVLSNFSTTPLLNLDFSTASELQFSDGFQLKKDEFLSSSNIFSHVSSLKFDSFSKEIYVKNEGAILSTSPIAVLSNNFPDTSLKVLSQGRISLTGSSIQSDGGTFFAPDGTVVIKGVNNQSIQFSNLETIEDLNLSGSVKLDNFSSIDVSGLGFGKVQVTAKDVIFNGGSSILSQTFMNASSTININADIFRASGVNQISPLLIASFSDPSTELTRFLSTINQINFDGDKPAQININSTDIYMDFGVGIGTSAVGTGVGADININANQLLLNAADDSLFPIDSSILTLSISSKKGGDINIDSPVISIFKGGGFDSVTVEGTGASGDINIETKQLLLDGGATLDDTFRRPTLSTLTSGPGTAGNVNIDADRISIKNQATISNTSLGNGDAGNVTIEADFLEVSGDRSILGETGLETGISAFVFPDGLPLIPAQRDFIVATQNLNGDSGQVSIDVKEIKMDQGVIAVDNFAAGKVGEIRVKTDRLELKSSRISSNTSSGDGGEVNIIAGLTILEDSILTSDSRDFGLGGNISIGSDLIIGRGNNIISANSIDDRAGNISISAGALFLPINTEISATSSQGPQFAGTVEINQTQNEITFLNKPFTDTRLVKLIQSSCQSEGSSISEYGSSEVFTSIQEQQNFSSALNQQIQVAQQYTYENSRGEIVPFRRWLGIQNDEETGSVELVFSPDQNKKLHNLINSETSYCS